MPFLTVSTRLSLLDKTRQHASRRRVLRCMLLVAVLVSSLILAKRTEAQVVPNYGQFQPLNQYLTPGTAGQWAAMAGKGTGWSQPVRIQLDGEGDVTVYHSRPLQESTQKSPAQVGVRVGHLYRLRISNMPELPGVEVFPTIEIIDRMHPPVGRKHDFPIPVYLTQQDIETALNGNLVTRVVYVEQPQLAAPFTLDDATRVRTLLPDQNVLKQADRYGRPVVIVRIGGRLPLVHGETASFYGTGGPVTESRPNPVPAVNPAADDQSQSAELIIPAPSGGGIAQ